ncbi:hypothetical protein [Kitasatospora sp. SUK 42]|uniref:hypothetical protein n=1 Tax=Kitasatospora sp. SUK 42 TaxID=1588882 RepID=UPI0018CA3FF9|nr:hypothetical protein [Kitasatospora sp. SUK 42]MBV2153144.1 hypothetical protein [Kitasatospora sp. SUK 42]
MAERPRRRILLIALGTAVLVAGVGGGFWYWKPPQAADVPQSACWNTFTHDDLAALTGKGYRAIAWQGKGSFADRNLLGEAPACEITRKQGDSKAGSLASIETSRRDEQFQRAKTVAEAGGWEPARPAHLDFGPSAQGWLFHEGTVQVLVRCDFVQDDGSRTNFPYRLITVTGDSWSPDTPATKVHQIRIDAALRAAKELVRAQGCTNAPQLAEQAPAAAF